MDAIEKFSEKAQEIAYALLRVAAYMRRWNFRTRAEGLALELLEFVSRGDVDNALAVIAAVKSVVKLGAQVYEVETVNARILLDELSALEAGLRKQSGREPLPALQSLFTAGGAEAVADIADKPAMNRQTSVDSAITEIGNKMDAAINTAKEAADNTMTSIGAAIRQTAILDKIRSVPATDQYGNPSGCRMKDLIAAFPDVSERTIRYDLQRLLGQGAIERGGNGGPASFYRVRTPVHAPKA